MKVNFIIPNIPSRPTGGYKVMYEYANAFAEDGHDVSLYHVATVPGCQYRIPHWLRWLRTKVFYNDSKPKWFSLSNKIKTVNIPAIERCYIRKADANILTMWAEVLAFNNIGDELGRRFNLIQGYETWFGSVEDVHKSYQSGAYNIAISNYLADKVEAATTCRPIIIPNFIEEKFKILSDPTGRNRNKVAMLYSVHSYKGSIYGLEALKIAKESVQSLQVDLFGIFDKPKDLPEWIQYHKNPQNLPELYNSAAVFVSPSVNEGWDLPCTEAMACGCAVVCTDIDGHKEYARDNDTALLCQPENSADLAGKIVEIIQNDALRTRISEHGIRESERYSLAKSYSKFLDVVNREIHTQR